MISPKALRRMEIDPLWLLRIFTALPVLLILVAGGGVLWIYFFVLSLLPENQSSIDLPGLTAEVRVVRDASGIPGILGENEDDLALVLGYVTAQDRLWQMDFLRRAAQGRLSEILGPAYLDYDHLMRTTAAAKEDGRDEKPPAGPEHRWVTKYIEGINIFISSHAGKLPVEFSFLEYQPEEFSYKDVEDICRGLAWASSPAWSVDATFTGILGRLGAARALKLFPTDPAAPEPFVVSDLEGWQPQGVLFSLVAARDRPAGLPGLRGGCLWAVDGSRTRSGNPMTGCVVYQALAVPALWYQARLSAGDFHLSGAFVPGVPVAFAGTNQRVAWGCAPAPADDADLYVERLDSDSPDRYWTVGGWRKLKRTVETFRVKDRSSVSREIRFAGEKPLVSEPNDGRALSLRWTGMKGPGLLPALYGVNRARNGNNLRESLKSLVAPCLNVVWADAERAYGIQMAGRVPVRPPGSDGIVPMPGWTAVHDWSGFIPFDALPFWGGSKDGIAAVADERPGGSEYPVFMGCYWNDDFRHARVGKLLKQSKEHYRDTFRKIQTDNFSPLAQSLTPVILDALKDRPASSSEKRAIQVLGSWDFRMAKDSAGAAAFALIYQALVEELFKGKLSTGDYQAFTAHDALTARNVKAILVDRNIEWLDGKHPNEVIGTSFAKAMRQGASLMGSDPAKWKWGDVHGLVFRHALTIRSRFLELLYHVGPVSLSGSLDTIDLAGWSPRQPFYVIDGVSLRQICDMTHPPEIAGMSPVGSSGHFFSPHYKDRTRSWAEGGSFREPVERADIRQSGFSSVLFKPAKKTEISRR